MNEKIVRLDQVRLQSEHGRERLQEELEAILSDGQTLDDLLEMMLEIEETGDPEAEVDVELLRQLYSNYMLKIGYEKELPEPKTYKRVQLIAAKFGQCSPLTARRKARAYEDLFNQTD